MQEERERAGWPLKKCRRRRDRRYERVNTLMDRSGWQTRGHIIIATGKSRPANVSRRVFDRMENERIGSSDLIAEGRVQGMIELEGTLGQLDSRRESNFRVEISRRDLVSAVERNPIGENRNVGSAGTLIAKFGERVWRDSISHLFIRLFPLRRYRAKSRRYRVYAPRRFFF